MTTNNVINRTDPNFWKAKRHNNKSSALAESDPLAAFLEFILTAGGLIGDGEEDGFMIVTSTTQSFDPFSRYTQITDIPQDWGTFGPEGFCEFETLAEFIMGMNPDDPMPTVFLNPLHSDVRVVIASDVEIEVN